MLTQKFWRDAAERAVKSSAQFMLADVGGGLFDVWHTDWRGVLGAGLAGCFLSVMTSLASVAAPLGAPDTASLVDVQPGGKHRT